MGKRPGGGEAGDRRRLASRRVPVVRALAFAPPSRPTQDHYGAWPSDPVYGGGESDLGCSPDPRREAFPENRAPKYLVLDRDGKFSGEVARMLEYLGRERIRTAYRSPGQNGVAERWVGSCRRELLDHVIVLNESHRRRLVRDYLESYHDDRIHDALKKEAPTLRVVQRRPRGTAKVVGMPRVGGLHHRYPWQTAA